MSLSSAPSLSAPWPLLSTTRTGSSEYLNDPKINASSLPITSHSEQPSSPVGSASVLPLRSVRTMMEPQPAVAHPLLLTNSLRRRISDSSTSSSGSCGSISDSFGEEEELESEESGSPSSYQPCPHNKAKRRRRLRVAFQSQLVEKVHPYPRQHEDRPASSGFEQPAFQPPDAEAALWYTHSELLAMKRVAKRTCARNHDLEHALNDAYHQPPPPRHHHPHHPSGPSSLRWQVHLAEEPEVLTDDSEQEVAVAKSLDGAAVRHDESMSVSSTPDEEDAVYHDVQQRLLSIPSFRELRGMERWSSQRHALSRGLTMLQVKTEVFVLQAQHSTQSSFMSSSSSFTSHGSMLDGADLAQQRQRCCCDGPNVAAVELARACSEASAPAARFARLMGMLDEAVARELQGDDDDE